MGTVSKFTILVLEQLGWYKGVNAEQNYTYLKGDGCGVIKNMDCNVKTDEYCSSEEFNNDHCYPNRLGKGHCGRDGTFMDTCGHIQPTFNALCTVEDSRNRKNFKFENYGPHSRCFMALKSENNYDAACLRTKCNSNGKVEIQFDKEVFLCESEGIKEVILSSYKGKIKCPKASEMCEEI